MGAEGQREPKHLQIYGSASRLIKRIDNLDRLVNEISPRPPAEKGPSVLEGPISLAEYLNTESSRLDSAAQKLEGLIDELKGHLY